MWIIKKEFLYFFHMIWEWVEIIWESFLMIKTSTRVTIIETKDYLRCMTVMLVKY